MKKSEERTKTNRSQSTRQTGSHNSQARWFALSTKFGMTQSGTRLLLRHPELVSGSKSNNRKAAFTLAEVLITLGIIGIVAAMTLPTLIHKYQAKVLKSYFQKSYSLVSNAIMMAKADLGIGDFAKFCTQCVLEATPDCYVNKQQCYESLLNGLNLKPNKCYGQRDCDINRSSEDLRTYNNKPLYKENVGDSGTNVYVYKNKDDSYIGFIIMSYEFSISIDTNGAKKPNRLGHDIFMFTINKQKDSLEPIKQTKIYTDEELEDVGVGLDYEAYSKANAGNPCSKNSNQAMNGYGCAWFAVNDINPDTGEKGYWENLPK